MGSRCVRAGVCIRFAAAAGHPTHPLSPSRRVLQGKRSFLSDYEMLEQIGTGTYATVYKCRHRGTGTMYAVKVFESRDYTPKQMAALRKEADIMAKVRRRNEGRMLQGVCAVHARRGQGALRALSSIARVK